MDIERLSQIISNENLSEVFYNEKPVWIQETNSNIARVGFLDGSMEKNVFIDDLYEK